VLELDVALAGGELVTCTPDNEHADLFFGFPNSYGTLGYATRVRARTVPVRPFVQLHHQCYAREQAFFTALAGATTGDADFVDGVAFGPGELVLTTARFVDDEGPVSDYSFRNIYYQSLRSGGSDRLAVRDYIWRWDTDWFWCSKNLGAQNPVVRRLLGPSRLNSRFYARVMRWNSRRRFLERLEKLGGWRRESVIQDVDVPLEHAAEFLEFFHREIGVRPLWICPVRRAEGGGAFPLFPMKANTLYVNFGFWDVLRFRQPRPEGFFNRMIEDRVEALGGLKSLYSSAWYSRERFDLLYGGEAYAALKSKYDPRGRFPNLYDKCVRGA
jgi:FAD/FMN-containing dehydrogenase